MSKLKKFYFVGNAHLDPVWQWRWQEGSAEAKATIRSALDRMKEYPDFKFVCSSSQVYEWIEEFDPAMFAEIRQRVQEGRFIVVGGWFIQPDCNLPGGEGFARQSLYGQRYFYEKFGVTARTGYNVDSFGHNAMLPQILKKSGMDYYVAMRPGEHEKHLPSHVMRWVSPDGSEVLFARIIPPYCVNNLQGIEDLQRRMDLHEEEAGDDYDKAFFFYGVGNHGGGPTKKNIETILQHAADHPDVPHIFSNTHDFFEELEQSRDKLTVLRDDLQHHASGCYSAVSAIKNGIRRAEWSMFAAENYAMLAKQLLGKKIPAPEVFAAAWKNILFAHFHDSMGGCSAQPVYDDAALFLGETRAMAQRTENNALQTVSWNIDTSDASRGFPIVVFNPHGFPVRVPVEVHKQIHRILDAEGKPVASQLVRSPDSRCRDLWANTLFMAEIPAFGYATYYYRADVEDWGFTAYYTPNPEECAAPMESPVHAAGTTLENECLRAILDPETGCLISLFDKTADKELLSGPGAVPEIIDETGYDTWAHREVRWDRVVGRFACTGVEVLESGPVRAEIKVTSTYGASKLVQYFSLSQGCHTLDVRVKLHWHEQHKMLKLRFAACCTEEPRAFYEIPYGVFERPADGEEEPGQSWTAVKNQEGGLALLNDSKYSFSIEGAVLSLSAVRSPYYNDHGVGNQEDSESEYTDQGEQTFRYALMAAAPEGWSPVIRAARQLNLQPTVILENNHNGTLPTDFTGIRCSCDNVVISAWKQSENGKGMILRAYETDGVQTDVTIDGAVLPVPLHAVFTPFSIQTYYLETGSDAWKEVLLTEFDCKQ